MGLIFLIVLLFLGLPALGSGAVAAVVAARRCPRPVPPERTNLAAGILVAIGSAAGLLGLAQAMAGSTYQGPGDATGALGLVAWVGTVPGTAVGFGIVGARTLFRSPVRCAVALMTATLLVLGGLVLAIAGLQQGGSLTGILVIGGLSLLAPVPALYAASEVVAGEL